MRKQVKIGSVLLMVVLLSTMTAAVQKPVVQEGVSTQLLISGQDVITASDAGGGYLSTRDIVLICLIVLAVIGLGVLI